MVALVIEFSLVVAWFLWLHRRQTLDRRRAKRLRWRQMRLAFEECSDAAELRAGEES